MQEMLFNVLSLKFLKMKARTFNEKFNCSFEDAMKSTSSEKYLNQENFDIHRDLYQV